MDLHDINNHDKEGNLTRPTAKAKVKAPAAKKPAPSLTAQLKVAKAFVKHYKEELQSLSDELTQAKTMILVQDTALAHLNAEVLGSRKAGCKTSDDLIRHLGQFRTANSDLDPTTDAVILRLINRLTNIG